MRLKLSISVPHGEELKEVYVVQQSAHTMGDVLASVVDEFGLQDGADSVAAFTLDGYHLGKHLEAWRCLEKDMVVKVRQVGAGAAKQVVREGEEVGCARRSEVREHEEEKGGGHSEEKEESEVARSGEQAGDKEKPSP